MQGRPHTHIFCWLVWNKELYNISRRQLGIHFFFNFLRGAVSFFILHLKGLSCARKHGTQTACNPCQVSSHSKRRNMKNCPGPTREADLKSHTTNQNCTVKRPNMFSEWRVYRRQWCKALIIQYRVKNVC